jgi:hypothetical protein
MPRVVHFEITAEDAERITKFYEEVFGWKVQKWEGPVDYWFLMTGDKEEPGIDGAFAIRREGKLPNTVNTIDVPSVDEYVAKIKENGGEIIREKIAIPGVGYLAYFKDTEGNMFGIMEDNPEAS